MLKLCNLKRVHVEKLDNHALLIISDYLESR